jgi:hypothetical protein
MPGAPTIGVVVSCPKCGKPQALATVTFKENSDGTPAEPILLAVTCLDRCQVDVTDPEMVNKLGLPELTA